MLTFIRMVLVALAFMVFGGCSVSWDNEIPREQDEQADQTPAREEGRGGGDDSPVVVDPRTGIPYANRFQFPVEGLDRTSFGFGFGDYNEAFPNKYHLGADTNVWLTPYDMVVVAPADGIVRISTDVQFSYFGSDSGSSANNLGCAIVLEHMMLSGQAVTTLIGHVQCQSGTYDPLSRSGSPRVGAIVHRGQYIGRVAHYWHGASTGTDWHHTHFGVRLGRFNALSYTRSDLAPFVRGYDWASEFTADDSGNKHHHTWLDPIEFVEGHADPVAFTDANVLRHPSGSLLLDEGGVYWIVVNDTDIARLTQDVIAADRYNTDLAVRARNDEIGCFFEAPPVSSLGEAYLYRRPFTNTIVVAYGSTGARYDFIRWEALVSWGFTAEDINPSYTGAVWRECTYNPEPDRRLRPGTLVKGDAETEVSIVTWQETRLPIQSGEIFEGLGFQWDRIVTIPQSVLDAVAGPREGRVFGRTDIVSCPALPSCEDGGTCGGGDDQPEPEPFCSPGSFADCDCGSGTIGTQTCLSDGSAYEDCQCPDPEPEPEPDPVEPEPDPVPDPVPPAAPIMLVYQGPVTGEIVLMAWWTNPDGSVRGWDAVAECADANPNDAVLECELPVPSGSRTFEFQINLPDGSYWGDHSCTSGGCDAPVGTLTLTLNGADIAYTFTPNPSGAPYYNGYLALVP